MRQNGERRFDVAFSHMSPDNVHILYRLLRPCVDLARSGDPGGGTTVVTQSREGNMVRKTLLTSVLVVSALNIACTSFGPKKVVSSHTAYNESVQLTVTREVLTNIVRSRYLDPMQFLSVSAINTQFSVSVDGSAVVGGVGQSGAAGDIGGSIGYSDSPTITFVPQSDNAFYKSLNSSFEISEVIAFDQQYRFSQSHPEIQALSLAMSFASINGADDFVAGDLNQEYWQRIEAIVQLLRLGASFRVTPEWDFDTLSIPRNLITAEDKIEAFKSNVYFVEEDGGNTVRMAKYRLVLAFSVPGKDDPEVVTALGQMGVRPGRERYVFRPPFHATPGFSDPHAIWVTARSMMDIINLTSYFVNVPDEHKAIVPALASTSGLSPFTSKINIRSSREEPAFPYKVKHRGYWFYIDDTEIASRVFLEAMVAAYSSRVGSMQAGEEGQPQVVIPVGGG